MNLYPLNAHNGLILSYLAGFDWCGVNSCLIKPTSEHIKSSCGGSWRQGEEISEWWINLQSGALNSTVTAAHIHLCDLDWLPEPPSFIGRWAPSPEMSRAGSLFVTGRTERRVLRKLIFKPVSNIGDIMEKQMSWAKISPTATAWWSID